MFNLFVIGSVQKPDRRIVDKFLPDIGRFGVTSRFMTMVADAVSNGADHSKLKGLVTGFAARKGAGEETIHQSEAELDSAFPELSAALRAYKSGDDADLDSALDKAVSLGRKAVCAGAPSLFATMTAAYLLDENHALVEHSGDLIKMAAASLEVLGGADGESRPEGGEARLHFVRDFMGKAIPRLGFVPPPREDHDVPLAPPPVEGEEADAARADPSARFAEFTELNEAIDALEALGESRAAASRYAPPALADFTRRARPAEAVPPTAEAGAPAIDKRQREPAPGETAEQSAKASHEQALATYSSRLIEPSDVGALPPAGRKALEPLAATGARIHIDHALEKLRQQSGKVTRELTRLPVKVERHVPQVLFDGFLLEIDRDVFDEITCEPQPKKCHCKMLQDMDKRHGARPQLYLLGTGTAYRIDTSFSAYRRGELVHTEPVVGGSKRTTEFRLLNRTEETIETFTSSEEEQEQEASSDERFRMEKEMEAETRSEIALNMGASVTASYGPVSLSANVGMSSSSARQSKERQASEVAQQKTARALSRIRKKEEKRTTSRKLSEDERKSGFTLDNEGKPSFTAFFHAIDAEYSNQLVEIGDRMVVRVVMQEFMAPLLHYMMSQPDDQKSLKKPIAPDLIPNPLLGNKLLTKFTDIDPGNYVLWLAAFGITEAPPPPDKVTASAHAHGSPGAAWVPGGGSITIPPGYVATYALVDSTFSGGAYIEGFIGNTYFFGSGSANLNLTGTVPWGYRGNAGDSFTLDIVVHCQPSPAMMAEWQMKVYDAIWTKYRNELSDYENSLQMAKVEAGIQIAGRNPRLNERLIREELMKMVLGATFPQLYYRGLNSMKFGYKCSGTDPDTKEPIFEGPPIPEPDFIDALGEAPWVTFMTRLFEFENMTFDLKPYFFGNRARWATLRKMTDADPRMEAALGAGHVTIDVPVALGMEQAFMHYLATGQVWNGQGMPLIGDPLYEALAIEVMNNQNPGGKAVGQPWTTILPTSLVTVSDTPPPNL